MVVATTQRCPRCDTDLPLDAFPDRHQGKPGNYCRECARAYAREYARTRPRRPPKTTECTEDGCTRRVRHPGPCAPCRRASTPPPEPATGYRAVHKRIQRARGWATDHACAQGCGAQADQWAYDHTDPDALVDTTNGECVAEYSTDIDRYLPMCRSCHSSFDKKNVHDEQNVPSPRNEMQTSDADPIPRITKWWEMQ